MSRQLVKKGKAYNLRTKEGIEEHKRDMAELRSLKSRIRSQRVHFKLR